MAHIPVLVAALAMRKLTSKLDELAEGRVKETGIVDQLINELNRLDVQNPVVGKLLTRFYDLYELQKRQSENDNTMFSCIEINNLMNVVTSVTHRFLNNCLNANDDGTAFTTNCQLCDAFLNSKFSDSVTFVKDLLKFIRTQVNDDVKIMNMLDTVIKSMMFCYGRFADEEQVDVENSIFRHCFLPVLEYALEKADAIPLPLQLLLDDVLNCVLSRGVHLEHLHGFLHDKVIGIGEVNKNEPRIFHLYCLLTKVVTRDQMTFDRFVELLHEFHRRAPEFGRSIEQAVTELARLTEPTSSDTMIRLVSVLECLLRHSSVIERINSHRVMSKQIIACLIALPTLDFGNLPIYWKILSSSALLNLRLTEQPKKVLRQMFWNFDKLFHMRNITDENVMMLLHVLSCLIRLAKSTQGGGNEWKTLLGDRMTAILKKCRIYNYAFAALYATLHAFFRLEGPHHEDVEVAILDFMTNKLLTGERHSSYLRLLLLDTARHLQLDKASSWEKTFKALESCVQRKAFREASQLASLFTAKGVNVELKTSVMSRLETYLFNSQECVFVLPAQDRLELTAALLDLNWSRTIGDNNKMQINKEDKIFRHLIHPQNYNHQQNKWKINMTNPIVRSFALGLRQKERVHAFLQSTYHEFKFLPLTTKIEVCCELVRKGYNLIHIEHSEFEKLLNSPAFVCFMAQMIILRERNIDLTMWIPQVRVALVGSITRDIIQQNHCPKKSFSNDQLIVTSTIWIEKFPHDTELLQLWANHVRIDSGRRKILKIICSQLLLYLHKQKLSVANKRSQYNVLLFSPAKLNQLKQEIDVMTESGLFVPEMVDLSNIIISLSPELQM